MNRFAGRGYRPLATFSLHLSLLGVYGGRIFLA
jgi:hypothetical protein